MTEERLIDLRFIQNKFDMISIVQFRTPKKIEKVLNLKPG